MQDTVQILEKLVSFQTISRTSNLDLIDWVRAYLEPFGVECQILPSPEGNSANLLAMIGPQAPGGVVLSGHTDVVPVDGQKWSTDPFRLTRKGEKLFGRGTCDMKGFVAACLAHVPQFAAADLKRPIYIALSYDEEVGCIGAPALATAIAKSDADIDAVIVGEPSGMDVIEQHKGAMAGKICFHGVAAHSSLPHLGVSATRAAAKFVQLFSAIEEDLRHSSPKAEDFFPAHTTFNVSAINGESANNIIPAYCELRWSARLIPGDEKDTVLSRIEDAARSVERAMVEENPQCRVTFELTGAVPAMRREEDPRAAQLCRRLSQSNTFGSASFATEGGCFQNAGLSSAICGPGSIEQAHKPDEFIELRQLHLCTQFLERLSSHQSR